MDGENLGAGTMAGDTFHEDSSHERRYRALIELNPDAVLVHSGDGICYANPAALRLAGVSEFTALVGRSIFEFLDPSEHDTVRERIRDMLASGRPAPSIDLHVRAPDGSLLEVEAIAVAVPWHGERAIQVILRDITERKRYEKALRESEARFQELADAMPQIVWSANAKGEMDYQNKRFFEQTGLTAKDAVGVNIWPKILHPEDVLDASRKWRDAVRTGQSFEHEYRYIDVRRGGYRWHLGRAIAVRNAKGEVVRWFGTCTDIHDKKQAEIELQQARDQLGHTADLLEKQVAARTEKLQASVRSMEEFCYSIAHNLRAPLRAMQGFASAILEDYSPSLGAEGQDYAQRIVRSAAEMDRLVHDLLSYGRLNHQTIEKKPIPLEPVVQRVVALFGPEIKRRNAVCQVHQITGEVRANEAILELLLTNLISNALKFSRKEVPPQVSIRTGSCNGFIRLSVRDNGIGIEPSLQPRIFRPFERLHTTDEYSGTGIGLALVAKGVERMGGRVGVESEPGQGSSFWIELPVAAK